MVIDFFKFYDDFSPWHYDMKRNSSMLFLFPNSTLILGWLAHIVCVVDQGSHGAWSDSLHAAKPQMLLLPCESGMCKSLTYLLCSKSKSILSCYLLQH